MLTFPSVHVKTSIDLSSIYLQLGQLDTATKVLASANDLAESNAAEIDISTHVILRLLHADILARDRHTEQRYVTVS
jgi:hypothetical protein